MLKHCQTLPIHKFKKEIIETIFDHKVTIISGETGSGKTTQVPQFLLENSKITQNPVKIICTEPRRIAAVSVSERVAEECGTQVSTGCKSEECRLFNLILVEWALYTDTPCMYGLFVKICLFVEFKVRSCLFTK